MWKMFNTKFPEYAVKESFFRALFNTKFNLVFNALQTDVCSRCLELKSRIKNTRDLNQKQELMTESRIHKLKAKAFFDLLKEEKAEMLTMSYDCQKNLVVPKIPDQQANYKRHFYMYNFAIVVGTSKSLLKKDNVFCYTWKETDKGKGSNEIASAIFDRLQKLNLDNVTDLRLCSYGCRGQNKNLTMITMVCTWLQRAPTHVKSIELVFPVTGHSYIPPDRVFANIEKKIRKKDTIINPQEYLDLFSESGSVQVLGVNWKVYDWQEQVKAHVRATSSLPFKINSCKRVIITKNTKGNVIVQGEPFYKHLIGTAQGICKKGKTFYDINPDEMSTGNRNIKPEKIKNVDELLTGHFGSTWKEEAENLRLQYYRDVLCDENRGNEEVEDIPL
ncbi:unnamed protein product [Psylliodes chrysocephalus]|uniref:DUF7869 domain-containing protein n=1 Tax=Psylliodes chrysocephalus TaxID=3402493 RepID=A0A9P0D097_9CUCU|nr:unnamed protein product [Psylliodes chrysocephala]